MTAIIIGLVGSLRQGSYNGLWRQVSDIPRIFGGRIVGLIGASPLLAAWTTPGRMSVCDLTWTCGAFVTGWAAPPASNGGLPGDLRMPQLYVSAA